MYLQICNFGRAYVGKEDLKLYQHTLLKNFRDKRGERHEIFLYLQAQKYRRANCKHRLLIKNCEPSRGRQLIFLVCLVVNYRILPRRKSSLFRI